MNATQVLVAQHRTIEALFDELATETGRHARRRTVSRVTEDLIAHMAVEETIFYPATLSVLAGSEGSKGIGMRAPDLHFMLRAQLRRVLATHLQSPAFVPRFEALRLLFDHHVQDEETEIFPRVEAALAPSELRALGADVMGSRPPIWVVTAETAAFMASKTDRLLAGVCLPSLSEN